MKRKAYAVLDGGGVKGAALAGCLKAAEEIGLEFVGYGGTSAGSIVALLAAVGYTGRELEQVTVDEIEFTEFLDDGGAALDELKSLSDRLVTIWKDKKRWYSKLGAIGATGGLAWDHRRLIKILLTDFGLYHAEKLQKFLRTKICEKTKFSEFQKDGSRADDDITFDVLAEKKCPLFYAVSSDLHRRAPRFHSLRHCGDWSVIDAVRASMSYPFVFKPVSFNQKLQVDGGVCSNLPLSVFEKERKGDGLPIIAFDLLASKKDPPPLYRFGDFCGDMLATALESGDQLVSSVMSDVEHVVVPIPKGIETLDFKIAKKTRKELFEAGYKATLAHFTRQWGLGDTSAEPKLLRAPDGLILPILKAVVEDFEVNTPARGLRSLVMLPTGRGTRVVAYHFGCDGDADRTLELQEDAGATGVAWTRREVIFADLIEARDNYQSTWKMTIDQQSKIREDRKLMVAIPIFGRSATSSQRTVLGTLSVDTSTAREQAQWMGSKQDFVVKSGRQWAEILSARLLGAI
ncbi:MAG TPA: patatin-like phospholipase family protein [Chthoniobacterales bacterium]|nr:patatin-like phospholipase family protein [Chthoniobacterales bacterium]